MADELLARIAEAEPVEQQHSARDPDTITRTASRVADSSHASQHAMRRAKRAQVQVACRRCRQRKIKCNAARPCASCASRNETCEYEAEHGETHSQAVKRKYDDMACSLDTHLELFGLLRDRSTREAADIVRYIRLGRSPQDVLDLVKSGPVVPVPSDPRKIVFQTFLINLAHSTGSLRDIIRLATLMLDPAANAHVPYPRDFLKFRNRIVYVPYVENLIQLGKRLEKVPEASSSFNTPVSPEKENRLSLSAHNNAVNRDSSNVGDEGDEGDDHGRTAYSLHQVPAVPWTTLTSDDEAVSHLVSIFLCWINPAWRFVEQDLFLLGMRSQRPQSEFCSPFLVNSICAIASLHSEHEVAYSRYDDRITRGEHFHDEALRLWHLEENRATLTNIQALCILSLESNYRANDKFGLSLVPIAVELNNQAPVHCDDRRHAAEGVSSQEFARARLATHWMVNCTQIIMHIAFMNGTKAESRVTELPKIRDVFDDVIEAWIGYPLTSKVVLYRPTLYLQERCKLAELFHELHAILFSKHLQRFATTREYASAVDDLSAKMESWHQRLPFELHYQWPMSVAVWELQFVRLTDTSHFLDLLTTVASYLASLMTLWVMSRTRFQQDENRQEDERSSTPSNDAGGSFCSRMAQQNLARAIRFAHRAAQLLRDFRERYGFKISPAWLLQLQAVTAGVLIKDPELAKPALLGSPGAEEDAGQIQDSHAAFEEVFRSLLGTGVEVLIARGIARMMYHTALEHSIVLSRSTRAMLQIMADTAWRPSDLSSMNSVYPNFATTKGYEDHVRMTDMLSEWEKLEI